MDEATAPQFDPARHNRGGRPPKRPEERRGEFVGFWILCDTQTPDARGCKRETAPSRLSKCLNEGADR
jgi:hypothetical protein